MKSVSELGNRLANNIEKVIVGKRDIIDLAIIALIARGHLLVEDVPGTGKTMLARSVAASLGVDFKRVQCTPDLLPSDLTGSMVYNQKAGEFEFRPGPVFVGVLLADEINRATPRTQAALLEAMQERQVSADGVSRRLPEPFLVLATENPVEFEGTFPLPEAQLDRFLMRISLGYPSPQDEASLLSRHSGTHPIDSLNPVSDLSELAAASTASETVHVSPEISAYIVSLSSATRDDPSIVLGVSPRGSIALYRAAQVRAAMDGRDFVIPDDVRDLALPVMSHRITLQSDAVLRGVTPDRILERIVATIPLEETPSRP